MILLKDLKSVLYPNESVQIFDEDCKLAGFGFIFYGYAEDIPQELDDCVVTDIFINANDELSIAIM